MSLSADPLLPQDGKGLIHRLTELFRTYARAIDAKADIVNVLLYVPTVAGAPTGTPASMTSRVPMVYDTTNNFLYVYNGGAWKKTSVFA